MEKRRKVGPAHQQQQQQQQKEHQPFKKQSRITEQNRAGVGFSAATAKTSGWEALHPAQGQPGHLGGGASIPSNSHRMGGGDAAFPAELQHLLPQHSRAAVIFFMRIYFFWICDFFDSYFNFDVFFDPSMSFHPCLERPCWGRHSNISIPVQPRGWVDFWATMPTFLHHWAEGLWRWCKVCSVYSSAPAHLSPRLLGHVFLHCGNGHGPRHCQKKGWFTVPIFLWGVAQSPGARSPHVSSEFLPAQHDAWIFFFKSHLFLLLSKLSKLHFGEYLLLFQAVLSTSKDELWITPMPAKALHCRGSSSFNHAASSKTTSNPRAWPRHSLEPGPSPSNWEASGVRFDTSAANQPCSGQRGGFKESMDQPDLPEHRPRSNQVLGRHVSLRWAGFNTEDRQWVAMAAWNELCASEAALVFSLLTNWSWWGYLHSS